MGLSAATLTGLAQLPGGVPKGYLRVLSFNEDSVLVDQRTVQLSAAALGHYETLSTGPLVVQQNGYVSVYVGNESAADVYFDDVRVEHRQGLQVQENQYDPFGVTLAGINHLGALPENKYQFNGKEQERELGLNWQDFNWRHYDPATARFFGVDRLAEKFVYMTDYQFASNNPTSKVELDGPEGISSTIINAALQPNVTRELNAAPPLSQIATFGVKAQIGAGVSVKAGGLNASALATGFSMEIKSDLGLSNTTVEAVGLQGSVQAKLGDFNIVKLEGTVVKMAGSFNENGKMTSLTGDSFTKKLEFGDAMSTGKLLKSAMNVKENFSEKNLTSPVSVQGLGTSIKPTGTFNPEAFGQYLGAMVKGFGEFVRNFVDTGMNPQNHSESYQDKQVQLNGH